MRLQSASGLHAWNVDVHLSGNSGSESADYAEEICSAVSVQFCCGILFGIFVDVHKSWVDLLPQTMMLRIAYFVISYLTLCVGIALSNRCKMPIVPTDLFPREVSAITKIPYSRVKVTFDVCCLAVTAILTFAVLGHIDGLGIGTVLAAFTMGKVIGKIGEIMDRHLEFVSFLSKQAGSRSAY